MIKLEDFFKVCSSKINLELLIHLYLCEENECNVQSLVELTGQKQANISKHFMYLRKLKLVESFKNGANVFYKLNPKFKKTYSKYLDHISLDPDYSKFACECIDWNNVKREIIHNH